MFLPCRFLWTRLLANEPDWTVFRLFRDGKDFDENLDGVYACEYMTLRVVWVLSVGNEHVGGVMAEPAGCDSVTTRAAIVRHCILGTV
jgi:hypothetical protein